MRVGRLELSAVVRALSGGDSDQQRRSTPSGSPRRANLVTRSRVFTRKVMLKKKSGAFTFYAQVSGNNNFFGASFDTRNQLPSMWSLSE